MIHLSERTKTTMCIVIVLIVGSVVVAPVLTEPHFGILDAPRNYALAKAMRLFQPSTYLSIPCFSGRSAPGLIFYFFPAHFFNSALLHYLYKTILLLFVPLVLVYWLVYYISYVRWMAAACAMLCLANISFAECYYSIFKAEPYILTGALFVTFLLWRQLYQYRCKKPLWQELVLVLMSAISVVFIYTIKETGAAFFAVYCVGLAVLCWASPYSVKEAAARTWWLSLTNMAGFAVFLYFYLRIKDSYTVTGVASYSLRVKDVIGGLGRIANYVLVTAPYFMVSVALLVVIIVLYWCTKCERETQRLLGPKIAWTVYFGLLASGMMAICAPWSEIVPHYLLVGATAAIIATVLCVDLALCAARQSRIRIVSCLLRGTVVIITAILLPHAMYSIVVGVCSEGRVRCNVDRAYGDMFDYLARAVPSNGVVYLLLDSMWPEPRVNTRYALDVLYGRPDIKCRFPERSEDFDVAGLVVVPDYAVPMNYDRMPIHHDSYHLFYNDIAPRLRLTNVYSMVYSTYILYASSSYHGAQYTSCMGLPAFWRLKKGIYRFGWQIAGYEENTNDAANTESKNNRQILWNGDFDQGMSGWRYWGNTQDSFSAIAIVSTYGLGNCENAVRIQSTSAQLIGIQQNVKAISNAVYRLSGAARSTKTTRSDILFGGRIAFYLPGQPEKEIVWVSECNTWWPKELVFTNQVTGTAVVYVHLGYGKVATTGEFSAIRLERVGE